MPITKVLAWAWIIIVGGLLITPGGVWCIACGPASRGYIGDTAVLIIGLVSVVVGVVGLVGALRGKGGQTVR
jgi:hypothetical protein